MLVILTHDTPHVVEAIGQNRPSTVMSLISAAFGFVAPTMALFFTIIIVLSSVFSEGCRRFAYIGSTPNIHI